MDPSHDSNARSASDTPAATKSQTGFYAPWECRLHEVGSWHPECAGRVTAIDELMIASGVSSRVVTRQASAALDEDLARVHPSAYIEALREASPADGYTALDPDTVMGPATLDAVLAAAGAAVAATDAVVSGEVRNAFCNIRPPGHHAGISRAMGFCFLNNVAIAARRALEVHGIERVAIVDFDVHHGNGTEEIFTGDERVLMVSFFQHPFYPYSGTDTRADNMVNVPLSAGSDGAAARKVVRERWLPALEAFRPGMIFISAGFDAHRDDDLGQMRLVEADYVWMTERILEVAERHAQGRVVSCLEGGYNLSALAKSAIAHVGALAQA